MHYNFFVKNLVVDYYHSFEDELNKKNILHGLVNRATAL